MSRYQKTIAAIVGAILATIGPVWDLHVTQSEATQLVIAWATALGVYTVPNSPVAGGGRARDENGRFVGR